MVSPELEDWARTTSRRATSATPTKPREAKMIAAIDAAKAAGDTLGGRFVVRVDGMPVGVGSNRQPETRLDGMLAGALMGMQTVKASR